MQIDKYWLNTHEDINVAKADAAVGDERCVEGVEVGDALHVGDEDGDGGQEHHQDPADDGRVETLVVSVLLLQPHVQL